MDPEADEWRRAREFVDYVDQEHFENQFVVWTAVMLNGDGSQDGLFEAISRKCTELEAVLEGLTGHTEQSFSHLDVQLEDEPTQVLRE